MRLRAGFAPKLRQPAVIARLAVIAPVAVALLYICVSVGIANFGQVRALDPELALRYAPFDARARASLSEAILTISARRGGDSAPAGSLAREAIARDPTIVSAWRTLAILAELRGDRIGATRLFHFAERLSRRDLPTQLWLIEERVAADDIPGALRHYDVALRTSPEASSLLIPVLVSATSSNAIVGPLAQLMATNPPWLSDLMARFSEGSPSAPNLAALLQAFTHGRSLPRSETMSAIIGRMVNNRDFEPAWRIHRLLRRISPAELYLRNGGFSDSESLSPFDWQFANEGDLQAGPILLTGAGQGPVLEMHTGAGQSGTVARQLLVLAPGPYSLSATMGPIGDAGSAQLRWNLSCAGAPSNTIGETVTRIGRNPEVMRATFRVPAGCAAQWLKLDLRADSDSAEGSAWADSVEIRPGN
jgi:hypothetical protein